MKLLLYLAVILSHLSRRFSARYTTSHRVLRAMRNRQILGGVKVWLWLCYYIAFMITA